VIEKAAADMRNAPEARQKAEPVPVSEPEECGPVCEENPYPLLQAGKYEAQCVHSCLYRDLQFRRWTALLRFQLLASGSLTSLGPVCAFLNLGNREKSKAGRRSRYWRAWVIANGEQPRKRQVLSPRVFKGKIFEVEIGTVKRAHDGREHPVAAQYSTVKEILERRWP